MSRLTKYIGYYEGFETKNPINIDFKDDESRKNYKKLVNELGKYESNKEKGLVLKIPFEFEPPFKVGEKVYFIGERMRFYETAIVKRYLIYGANEIKIRLYEYNEIFQCENHWIGDICIDSEKDKIYPTKEEAEQALAEMKGV